MEGIEAVVLTGAVRLAELMRHLAVLRVEAIARFILTGSLLAFLPFGRLTLLSIFWLAETLTLVVITGFIVVANPFSSFNWIRLGSSNHTSCIRLLLTFTSSFHLKVFLDTLSIAFLSMLTWHSKLSFHDYLFSLTSTLALIEILFEALAEGEGHLRVYTV